MRKLGLLLLRILSAPAYRRFRHALRDPRKSQRAVLLKLLEAHSRTDYGRSLGLSSAEARRAWMESPETFFASTVPMVQYDQLADWIEKQGSSRAPVLSPFSVICFEKTSGSSGRNKMIPYTRPLLGAFREMFLVWSHDILIHGPKLKSGKVFMSVSPVFNSETTTELGVPIGLEDDSDYLDSRLNLLLDKFLVLPRNLKRVKDPFQYRFILSLALLSAPDLEIVSIWNPTYLEALLDFIQENRRPLLASLRQGEYRHASFHWKFRLLPAVKRELGKSQATAMEWKAIWPELKLVSCWMDGSSEAFAERLRQRFPGVLFQGKGLLATEAPMTIPLIRPDRSTSGGFPLLDQVYFEFIGEDGKVGGLCDLRLGGEYEIVVSQPGGFLRYRIGDRVQVVDFDGNVPLFRFLGRSALISDMVGEKLNARFLEQVIQNTDWSQAKGFYFLFADNAPFPPRYRVAYSRSDTQLDRLSEADLENLLQGSIHYRLARQLGQLAPLEKLPLKNAETSYYRAFESMGMKWGDIKFNRLVSRPDFAGLLHEMENES